MSGFGYFLSGAALLAFGTAASAQVVVVPDDPPAAEGDYFVRAEAQHHPYYNYPGEEVLADDLVLNSGASASAEFDLAGARGEAHVDLAAGTIKTYLSANEEQNFTQIRVSGSLGDVIQYTGSEDVAVRFQFDTSGLADFNLEGALDFENSQYASWEEFSSAYNVWETASIAVYAADADVDWSNWNSIADFRENDAAIYHWRAGGDLLIDDERYLMDMDFSIGEDLFLTSGQSYMVFAQYEIHAYSTDDVYGEFAPLFEIDALNTGRFSINAPEGSFTSLSGEFLGFAKTPGDNGSGDVVPEPASWAMMILGFGLVGGAMRRQRRLETISAV